MAEKPSIARPGYGEGRVALLDAAISVVARSGLRGLTYRAVAREAGVTHALVAHHFGSRDALISDALQHAAQRSIDASISGTESGDLDDFASGLVQLLEDAEELQVFQYEMAFESRRRPELVGEIKGLYQRYTDAIAGELGELGLPADPVLARVVYAALDGLVMQRLLFGASEATEDSLAKLREMIAAMRDRRA